MRTRLFLFVYMVLNSLLFSFHISAQVLTAERHRPLPTDSLWVYKLPYIQATDSGRDCIWDFSGISTDSAEYIDLFYYIHTPEDSTLIGLHRERAHYYYQLSQDTLWLTAYENSRTYMHYFSSIPILHFPLAYGDSLSGTIIGDGQYCHVMPLSVSGQYSTRVDATGRLILPDMEIDSVLRVHSLALYHEQKRTQNAFLEERYAWYSLYCRYPLWETVFFRSVKNTDTVCIASSYYFPQEQENIPERPQSLQDDSPLLYADSLITDVSYMPNPVYADLRIHYSLSRTAQVYISFHYNGGITTYQTPVHIEEEGVHVVSINMGGMPMGNYVVYIHADDTIVSGNVVKL